MSPHVETARFTSTYRGWPAPWSAGTAASGLAEHVAGR